MAFAMKKTKITADHEGKVLILRLYPDVCVRRVSYDMSVSNLLVFPEKTEFLYP